MKLTLSIELTRDEPPMIAERESAVDSLVERSEFPLGFAVPEAQMPHTDPWIERVKR